MCGVVGYLDAATSAPVEELHALVAVGAILRRLADGEAFRR